MADILQFPTARVVPNVSTREARIEAHRKTHRSEESALAPFYGTLDPDPKMVPFFAYGYLSVTGHTPKLRMPDKTHYFLDHARDAQTSAWGEHLAASVITEANWWGTEGNEPWRGLADPLAFFRSSILGICVQLKTGGADTRIIPKLTITLRVRKTPAIVSLSQLELCFAARRRMELVRSAN